MYIPNNSKERIETALYFYEYKIDDSGIMTNIKNPAFYKRAALGMQDPETYFVASGLLTHEEYLSFKEMISSDEHETQEEPIH